MRKWASKGVLILCLLFVLVLAGCDFFSGIFDPLIGSWEYSLSGLSLTYTFHADSTWEGVMSVTGYADSTASGTYKHDTSAKTLEMTATSGGTGTVSYTYEISTDRKTLTLTEGVIVVDFTRK